MSTEDAAWEAMSMRQLRSECKSRGIDVSGCLEKQEFIRRLRAAAGSPPESAAAASEPCQKASDVPGAAAERGAPAAMADPPGAAAAHNQTVASRGSGAPAGASGGADDWSAMPARELRRQASLLGVDIAGCCDKAEMIDRLRAARAAAAAGDTRCTDDRGSGAGPRPLEELASRPASEAHVNGSTRSSVVGVDAPVGEVGAGDGRPWEDMSVRELRKECGARGIDVAGCLDKADFVSRLQASASRVDAAPNGTGHAPHQVQPDLGTADSGAQKAEAEQGSSEPAIGSLEGMSTRELRKLCEAQGVDFYACIDKADIISRLRAKVTNDDASKDVGLDRGNQHLEEAKTPSAQPATGPTAATVTQPVRGSPTASGSGNADEVGAQADGVGVAASGVLVNGRPAEAVSVRQLRQECQALGIDIVGCYAKSEIIGRMRAHQVAGKPQQAANGIAHPGRQTTPDESPSEPDSQQRDDEGLVGARKVGSIHEVSSKAAPPPEDKSVAGADLDADGKRWEGMSMRQLKKECEDRGIDLTGCYAKCEVIRRLHAASEAVAAGAAQPRQHVANPNEPDVQEIADPPVAASETEVWQAMSTRELRMECELHGIDMLSCHDKADIIRQLRESKAAAQARLGRAARVDVADKASQSESEPLAAASSKDAAPPADAQAAGAAAQTPPAERRAAPGAETGSRRPGDLGPAAAAEGAGAREVALECGKRVALSAPSLSSLSARELRQECDALRVDLDGCLDRADIVDRLLVALEAKAQEATNDKQGTQRAPEDKRGGPVDVEVRAAPGEPDASSAVAGSATGAEAWEALSMRQLKSECKARGIDVTACYDKADIIGRLRAASQQAQAEAPPTPDAKASPTARRVPTSRARLSIADLYKLSIEELRQKCLEEGVSADPEEPKGALISRLRQSHSKATGFGSPAVARLGREPEPGAAAKAAAGAVPSMPGVGAPGASSAEQSSRSIAQQEAAASRAERRDTAPEAAPPPAPAESASPSGGSPAVEATGPEAVAGEGNAEGGPAPASEENKEEASTPLAPSATLVEPEEPTKQPPREDANATTAGAGHEADSGMDTTSSAAARSNFFDFDDLPDDVLQGPPSAAKAAAAAQAEAAAEEAKPPAAAAQEENWEGKSTSALKRECQQRGIDLTGCFEKGDYIRRLREAAKSGAGASPSIGAEAQPPPGASPASSAKAADSEQQRPASPQDAQPSTAQPAGKPGGQSSPPTIDTNTPTTPPPAASSTPSGWSGYSVKELLKMAKDKGIDVSGCCEKSDIIERLERGPVKTTPMKAQGGATKRAKSAAAPRTSTAAPKVPAKGASTLPGRSTSFSTPSSAEKEAFPGWKSPTPPTVKAKASAPPPEQNKDDPHRSPSGNLSWSPRVRRFFECYPGFCATLPPEAETWNDQQLEVYFGSNGEIWPMGRRPSWMSRPFEDQEPLPQVPKKKQYPDLKVHFETLDLAETTPPDMIRRHYRRLARDHHPDKNSDDPEGAAERFRKIQTAYEAIRDRLHL